MCFPKPKVQTPPPPAPPPVETGELSVKSTQKKKSVRAARATSGSAGFRTDLSMNAGKAATGLSIHR
jgi:hypothetical protein